MKEAKYDCVVCGAGPSGMAAAIALSKEKKKVLLIEETSLLGGTNILSLVGPLMTFHNQGKQVIGGIASDIVDRLIKSHASLGHVKDPFAFCSTITPYEVESLKALYFDLISEYNIELLLQTKVVGAKEENNRITAIEINNNDGNSLIYAKCYIDATGDADLVSYTSNPFVIGRNKDNLCQPMTMPFIVKGVDFEKIKTAIKNDPDNFDADPTYDYSKYVGVSGFFKEVAKGKENGDFNILRDRVLLFQGVKNDEAIINTTRITKYSSLDAKQLTLAELEGRKQIKEVADFLKNYIPGFENSYILSTPVRLGIRESRHVIGKYIITKEDIMSHARFYDTIAVGAYPMDIHSPVSDKLEIDDNYTSDLAYEIPLRIVISKNISNLLVTGRAVSATHEAAASLRVSPIVMALGEATGYMASLACKYDGELEKVNYQEVQEKIVNNGGIIHF